MNTPRLPPFARQLDPAAREAWVYFGSDGWHAAKCRAARRLPVLCLPPDRNPGEFRWPVGGMEILLIQQGRFDILQIPGFANLLLASGATVVRAIYGDGYVVTYKEVSHDKVA